MGGCWLARHRQTFRGRWRLMRTLEKHIDLARELKAAGRSVGGGFSFYIDPNDYNGLHYLLRGVSSRDPISSFLCSYLRTGDNVLDIGANVGYYTALASKLVGKAGRVLSFEASPTIAERLRGSLRTPHDNVCIHDFAVSDEEGIVTFYTETNGHTGRSSLLPHLKDEAIAHLVRSVALDTMLATIPPTALVKMDIEGAEMRALRGMRELLKRDYPAVVLEITNEWLRSDGSSAAELLAWVSDLGYHPYSLERRGETHRLASFELRVDLHQQDVVLLHASDLRASHLNFRHGAGCDGR